MALGSTQPLTEMSTGSISWDKKRPVRKVDNLTTIPGTLWAPRTYNRNDLAIFKFLSTILVRKIFLSPAT